MQAARRTWFGRVAATRAGRLIFLDETWFTTAMTRSYGYAPRGARLIDSAPLGGWTRISVVAGLTPDGLLAPYLFQGSMTGDRFEDYILNKLLPKCRPGDVLVLDNLSSHRTASVRALAKDLSLPLRYLPSYSPDLNPIEMAFAKLKALARKACERTVDGLTRVVNKLVRGVGPGECRNYIEHCGYPLQKPE